MSGEARCTGHCCREITIPLPPEQLRHFARVVAAGKTPGYLQRGFPSVRNYDAEEIRKLTAMLVPKATIHRRRHGTQRRFTYTCRHFDGTDCTAYAERPTMCKTYPYGGVCGKRGCTYKPPGPAAPAPEAEPTEGATPT